MGRKKHEDTSVSLHPLSFEEAIHELVNAPKQKDSQAEASDKTKSDAPESEPSEKQTDSHQQPSAC